MIPTTRSDGRRADDLRPIALTRHYTCHAEGSVLVAFGATQVICTATIEDRVPHFLKGKGQGWLTAEYSMLPRATGKRGQREATSGQQGGRTLEIQRMIGRSLRSVVDLQALGERTITLDCDVIQADGGTRTAAITGSYVALADAIQWLMRQHKKMKRSPLFGQIASVSVGIVNGAALLDLNYAEDSTAETDMNVVMNSGGAFVELQGTAEGHAFHRHELNQMLDLAEQGVRQLLAIQQQSLEGEA